jgi:hypothetical protein
MKMRRHSLSCPRPHQDKSTSAAHRSLELPPLPQGQLHAGDTLIPLILNRGLDVKETTSIIFAFANLRQQVAPGRDRLSL